MPSGSRPFQECGPAGRGHFQGWKPSGPTKFPFEEPGNQPGDRAPSLLKYRNWTVDVHQPQVKINLEIRGEGAFVYSKEAAGLGGLPVGSTGKALLLISGGIDSPVAGWLAMKRGIQPVGLHFYSFPFTSERSKEKVIDLCRVLARYGGSFKLYVNYFTEIQKAIRKSCGRILCNYYAPDDVPLGGGHRPAGECPGFDYRKTWGRWPARPWRAWP